MNLYSRFAGSHLGSSALFGGSFFVVTFAAEGLAQAAVAGSIAAVSWFAIVPLLKRVTGGEAA